MNLPLAKLFLENFHIVHKNSDTTGINILIFIDTEKQRISVLDKVRRLEFCYYLLKLAILYSILIPVMLSVQSRAAVHFFAVLSFSTPA